MPIQTRSAKAKRPKQLAMLRREASDYGGVLRNTRKGRSKPRPVAVRSTMHLILKSSKATGPLSFGRAKNDQLVRNIIAKFARVYGVKIVAFANAWNHLHLQIKLSSRRTYAPFVRSITGAIALRIAGRSALNTTTNITTELSAKLKHKFWDHRPFTRIADSYKAFLNLKDYIRMNAIESGGYDRRTARDMVGVEKVFGSG